MQTVETALLYVDHPEPDFANLCDTLNERMKPFDICFEAAQTKRKGNAVFTATGLQLEISANSRPLPADQFDHALDSPLSAPFQGTLSDMLFRHKTHVLVTVLQTNLRDIHKTDGMITALRAAHAASACVAEWHAPAAVHWRQSNQLITGAQYHHLNADPTPWALFAHARIFTQTHSPDGTRLVGLRLTEAEALIGRPILFLANERPLEHSYASALSFLRNAVENGEPLPDGHSFGPADGDVTRVHHRDASDKYSQGYYELSAVSKNIDAATPPKGMFGDRQASDLTVKLPQPVNLANEVAQDHHRERTRSLAISYLMLVIVPPIGLLLLISNLFFGANAARTGLIASTSVAAVVLVGAFTFLNITSEEVATLQPGPPVSTQILPSR